MPADRKRTEGMVLLSEDEAACTCDMCGLPAIFYDLETTRFRCLFCAIGNAASRDGFQGPHPVTREWCRIHAPSPLADRYCSLRRGHAGVLHEAWYAGDRPDTNTPLVVWHDNTIIYRNGAWVTPR